jgi:predicted 3-demethylubiquinone-9 3-methyltransferase (glyoxalase superfamily)
MSSPRLSGLYEHDNPTTETESTMSQKIVTNLWFDKEAEEAAEYYVSLFPNSKVTRVVRYPESTSRAGDVLTADFELDGQSYVALNGGPQFKFNEAISLAVSCEPGEEQDHYWDKLGEGGEHGPCGWLKDRYGLSWQVIPNGLDDLIGDPDPQRADRAMAVMMEQGKLDLDAIRRAVDG